MQITVSTAGGPLIIDSDWISTIVPLTATTCRIDYGTQVGDSTEVDTSIDKVVALLPTGFIAMIATRDDSSDNLQGQVTVYANSTHVRAVAPMAGGKSRIALHNGTLLQADEDTSTIQAKMAPK
jgi:hypothetical protein